MTVGMAGGSFGFSRLYRLSPSRGRGSPPVHRRFSRWHAPSARSRPRGCVMLKLLVAAVTFAALLSAPVAGAKEQSFKPNEQGQVEFQLPSGNIGCLYTP